MTTIVTAPNYYNWDNNYNWDDNKTKTKSLFLAGGISGCGNWQQEIIEKLRGRNLVIFNPRREGFLDRKDAKVSGEQILWESYYLRYADEILFWFPNTSICPIALFELGAALERKQTIYVGIENGYDRTVDLEIQIPLRRRINVVDSIDGLVGQVIDNL